jgi:hypothetical protein
MSRRSYDRVTSVEGATFDLVMSINRSKILDISPSSSDAVGKGSCAFGPFFSFPTFRARLIIPLFLF